MTKENVVKVAKVVAETAILTGSYLASIKISSEVDNVLDEHEALMTEKNASYDKNHMGLRIFAGSVIGTICTLTGVTICKKIEKM